MKKKILSVLLMTAVVLSAAGCDQYDYITMEEVEEWQNNNYEYDYNHNDNTDYNQPSNNTETNIENSIDTEEEKSDNTESGEAEYSENNLFKCGRALVQPKEGIYGFIDKNGDMVIEAKYTDAGIFTQSGLAAVAYNDENGEQFGFIDIDGNYVIGPTTKWKGCGSFSNKNNLAWVMETESGLCGYINTAGEYVIEPQYTYAQGFGADGLAMVTLNGKNIVIDETGACIFELPENTMIHRYDDFTENGLIRAVGGGKYGFLDKTGNWVIEPSYVNVHPFSKDGYTTVEKYVIEEGIGKNLWGIIDEQGNIIVEPQYDHLTDFDEEGIAEYSFDRTGESGYINYQGNPAMKLPEPSYVDGDLIYHVFDDGYTIIGHFPHYRIKDKDGNLLNDREVEYYSVSYTLSDDIGSEIYY